MFMEELCQEQLESIILKVLIFVLKYLILFIYYRIAFRHLEIHRSNDNIDILETFVKSAIGKHY